MSYYEDDPDYISQEEVEEINEEYRKKRLVEALIGPSLSTAFHIVLIVLLAFLIKDQLKPQENDIEVKIMPDEPPVDIPPIPDPPELIKTPEIKQDFQKALPIDIPKEETNDAVLVENKENEPESIDVHSDNDFSDIELIPSVVSNPFLRGAGGPRGGIKDKIKEHQVDPGTHTSFIKSLEWLVKVQNADGSWGNDAKSAYTGLALLTFLAHGETPTSRRYGTTVKKAMQWLVHDKIDTKSYHAYPHAVKAYALAEAYAMTGNSLLEEAMNKSIEVIIKGQQKRGAFDYNYKASEARQDLSFSGWNYQALKAASIAGCDVKGLEEAIYKSIEYLKLMGENKKSYAYTTSDNNPNAAKGAGKWTMKAVGTLCLQLLEPGKHVILTDELDSMLREGVARFDWNKAPKRSLYGWYYETNAMFHAQGKYWIAYRNKFAQELMANQHPDGYWVYPGNNNMPGNTLSKKVYATTLSALMLSVPFRYLPSSKAVATTSVKKEEPKSVMEDEGRDLIE